MLKIIYINGTIILYNNRCRIDHNIIVILPIYCIAYTPLSSRDRFRIPYHPQQTCPPFRGKAQVRKNRLNTAVACRFVLHTARIEVVSLWIPREPPFSVLLFFIFLTSVGRSQAYIIIITNLLHRCYYSKMRAFIFRSFLTNTSFLSKMSPGTTRQSCLRGTHYYYLVMCVCVDLLYYLLFSPSRTFFSHAYNGLLDRCAQE